MRASFPAVDGQFVYVAPSGLAFVNTAVTPPMTYDMRYAMFGVASPRQSISPFQQWADTLSFTKGPHSFQAGFEMDFSSSHQYNHGGQQTTRPFLTLGVGTTPVPNINTTNFRGIQANDITTAQVLLANLAGTVGMIEEQYFVNSPTAADWSDYRTTILFQRDLHENDWDIFFKDNWKVTKNLTLNLGLRYDKYGVPYDTTGLGGRFTGGQSALFGWSGKGFSVGFQPVARDCGSASPTLTTTERVGEHACNPHKLFWGTDWNSVAP